MSKENRANFIAKALVVGVAGFIGFGGIMYGIDALADGLLLDTILGFGIGVSLLVVAWRVMGD